MKLWKSPVFYFGIFLLLAVGAALLAPLVIDWGRYRTSIEDFGRRITGREVEVQGPISATLFPWPRLTLESFRVANPTSAQNQDFVTAERIEIQLSLAGFFNGNIQVESIDIIRPVISLERLAAGKGTWRITPTLMESDKKALQSVKLDKINVLGGRVDLIDGLRGGKATIADMNALLSAPALFGPWRLRGSAAIGDKSLDVSINTGIWKSDEILKFSVKLVPNDGGGLVYAFDGASGASSIDGTLLIDKALSSAAKSDPEGQLRPFSFKSKVSATFDVVDLDKIEISPKDSKDGANILTGTARITLGSEIEFDSKLKAMRFDLDAVAGAESRRMLREGAGLAFLESILDSIPGNVAVKSDISVTSLVAGGESLENVRLDAELNADAIRISELSGKMPGQSEALFDGIFIVTEKGPQLAGDVALETFNLRDLSKWIWPDLAGGITEKWKGSRGHLKLETRLDVTAQNFRLSEAQYSIDDSQGTASLSVTNGDSSGISLSLSSNLIDVDSFLPDGAAIKELGSLVALMSKKGDKPTVNVGLKTKLLRLNGTEANDVGADLAFGPAGFNIRHVELQQAGGSKLEASGSLDMEKETTKGIISGSIVAQDPRPLLQLAGVYSSAAEPIWSKALGPTELKLSYQITPESSSSRQALSVEGHTGALGVSANVEARNGNTFLDSEFAGSGEIKSASSRALAGIIGFEPVANVDSSGLVTVTINGSLSKGMSIDAQANAFGAELQYGGTIAVNEQGFSIAGRVGAMTEAPKVFLRALGWGGPLGALYSAEANLVGNASGLTLKDITGLAATQRFSGQITAGWDGKVSGEFTTGKLNLGDLLAATFLPWTANEVNLSEPLNMSLPGGVTGEIWFKPSELALFDELQSPESQIGIVADDQSIQLAVFGKTDEGKDLRFELKKTATGSEQEITGRLKGEVDLSRHLKMSEHQPALRGGLTAELAWSGKGRSLASILSGLKGSGSFALHDVRLSQIDLGSFSTGVSKATTVQEVKKTLENLTARSEYTLGDISGSLTMIDGNVALLPARIQGTEADVSIKPVFDVAGLSLDLNVNMKIKDPPDLPSIEIAYLGDPKRLVRNVESTELESVLGMRILQKGMTELEALQREQQRILEEEQQRAKEDTARLQAWEEHRREMLRRVRELNLHRLNWSEQQRREKERKESAPADPPSEGPVNAFSQPSYPYGPVYGSQEQNADLSVPAPKPRPRVRKPNNRPAKPSAATVNNVRVPVILVPPQQTVPPPAPKKLYNFNR